MLSSCYQRIGLFPFDDQERDLGDEYGWKLIHGDVFRPPPSSLLLSSLIGIGYHLAFVATIVSLIASLGTMYMGYVMVVVLHESLEASLTL